MWLAEQTWSVSYGTVREKKSKRTKENKISVRVEKMKYTRVSKDK